ncbi:hypothetical protein PAHAL_9G475300 [Panicum hallii]|uniref:Uncharacterized protein n=1 Tax=Panicum hallii TaxID=206008 RepID=A0A2T8I504_9POAL|nr:hypothetical protein PAHAL_9G475300 [Panicum hallii]
MRRRRPWRPTEVELPLQHCGPVPDCLVPRESSGETHPHAPPSSLCSPPAAPGTGTQGEAESPWFSSIVISPPACSCSSSLSQHVPAPAGSPRSTLPRAKTSATTHSPSQPANTPPPRPAPTPSSETPSSAPSLRFLHDADGCPGAAELEALPVDFSMHMYCFTYGLLVYDGRSVVVASSLAHIYCQVQHCQRRREGVRQNAQEGRGRVDRGLLVHAEWGMRGGIALSGVVEIVRQAHGRWRGQIHGPRVAWRRARCRVNRILLACTNSSELNLFQHFSLCTRNLIMLFVYQLNLSIEVKTVVPVGA